MPIIGWVSIGVAISSMMWTVVWYLVRRHGESREGRLKDLEAAVFGSEGVTTRLAGFVTHKALEERLVVIGDHMSAIKEEGERREERILDAIKEQTRVLGSALSEVRSDLRSQASRIDDVFRSRG